MGRILPGSDAQDVDLDDSTFNLRSLRSATRCSINDRTEIIRAKIKLSISMPSQRQLSRS